MVPSGKRDLLTGGNDVEKVLDRFEEAWQANVPPRIEDFLPALSPRKQGTNDPVRQGLIKELIRIDLGHRWRAAHPQIARSERPRLEHYLKRYPELGQAKQVLVELAGEEYRVRQIWGDRPSHAEFAARFSALGSQLKHKLVQLDADLADEGERPRQASPSITAATSRCRQCRFPRGEHPTRCTSAFRDSPPDRDERAAPGRLARSICRAEKAGTGADSAGLADAVPGQSAVAGPGRRTVARPVRSLWSASAKAGQARSSRPDTRRWIGRWP